MDAGLASRIERGVERGASAVFAAAVGYAAFRFAGLGLPLPLAAAASALAALIAWVVCQQALKSIGLPANSFEVPIFYVRGLDPLAAEETAEVEEIVEQPPEESPEGDEIADAPAEEPLVLDDVLAELEPDSRVISLFDPSTMPSPGELQGRIDQHLAGHPAESQPLDATQQLYDALAQLRQSLR
jgi:hypothetical protein